MGDIFFGRVGGEGCDVIYGYEFYSGGVGGFGGYVFVVWLGCVECDWCGFGDCVRCCDFGVWLCFVVCYYFIVGCESGSCGVIDCVGDCNGWWYGVFG